MTNPFDTLNGMDDIYGLGFFKKLKKAVKKLARPDKILKSSVKEVKRSAKKIGKEVKRNPVVAGVVVLAASAFLSPAVGAALKAGLASGAKAAVGAGKFLASGAKSALTAKNLGSAAKLAITVAQSKAQISTAQAQAAVAAGAQDVYGAIDSATPDFGNMVQQLQQQGYSGGQIQSMWANSDAYVDTTAQAAANEYADQAYNLLRSQGYSHDDALRMAPEVAAEMGRQAALDMRKEFNLKNAAPFLIGAGALVLLLKPKRR